MDKSNHLIDVIPVKVTSHGDRVESGLGVSLANPGLNVVEEGRKVIRTFFKDHSCYQLIKNSGKVVVFDVKIPVNLAFFALVEHEVKSAPLWNAEEGRFVGLLSASDLVNILRHYYTRNSPMSELASHSIDSWKQLPSSDHSCSHHGNMVSISPESSLYDALMLLHERGLNRLPVFDKKQRSVLAILSYAGILEYLVTSFREQRRLFDQSIEELGIGKFENMVTVPEDMPLIQVLYTLVEEKLHAVPIVNANGAVIDVYAVTDVTELAKDDALGKLDIPIGDILRMQSTEGVSRDGLYFCTKQDTLHMLFEKFASVKAQQLICTDAYHHCIGILSLSDLFQYFMME